MINKSIALSDYEKGMTLQSIANKFGVSRQRIWDSIKPFNPIRKKITNNYQTKKIEVKIPSFSEIWVAKELKKLGLTVEHTFYNEKFDLLVNKKIRIEVKYRSEIEDKQYYKVASLNKNNFDFLIAVLPDVTYIIPSRMTSTFMQLVNNRKNKSKHFKYQNAWHLIKEVSS